MDRGTRRARSDSARNRRSFIKQLCLGCRLREWAQARKHRKALNKKKHQHGSN